VDVLPPASRRSIRRRLLPALLAIVLVPVVAAGTPTPAAYAAGTPSCTYSDVTTKYRGYQDFYRTLVDTKWRVASNYAPHDLVSVSNAGLSGGGSVRRIVIRDLALMNRAARGVGARLAVESAYRSYSKQRTTFAYWVSVSGYRSARLASARPGHSEHQLGTVIDFKTAGGAAPWAYNDWGATKAGAWMRSNAWKFGFVMSYPKGKSPSVTCYKYEPWHYRYVGRPIATAIHVSGLSTRQWFYQMGSTSTWVGPGPTAPAAT
jgi:D-alanyl-D-alanine carboxypeptidase